MENPVNQKKEFKRVCIRFPVNILAVISGERISEKKVYMKDLSATGLSFLVSEADALPDSFMISFQLKGTDYVVKTQLVIKNRIRRTQDVRIGCIFMNPSIEDQDVIVDYLARRADLTFVSGVIGVGALFCAIDALFRVLLSIAKGYYEVIFFGVEIKSLFWQGPYSGVLIFYAIVSFSALILTDRIIDNKNRDMFRLGVICFLAAFVFSVVKNVLYWGMGIGFSNHLFIKIFFWNHFMFVIYSGIAMLYFLISIKKIRMVLGVENIHRKGLSGGQNKQ